DDAAAEVILPDTVDHDPRGEGIVCAGDPVGQHAAAARCFGVWIGSWQLWRFAGDDGEESRLNLVSLGARAAPQEDKRLRRPGPDLADAEHLRHACGARPF